MTFQGVFWDTLFLSLTPVAPTKSEQMALLILYGLIVGHTESPSGSVLDPDIDKICSSEQIQI